MCLARYSFSLPRTSQTKSVSAKRSRYRNVSRAKKSSGLSRMPSLNRLSFSNELSGIAVKDATQKAERVV